MLVTAVERFAQKINLNLEEIFIWYFEQKGVDNPERFLGVNNQTPVINNPSLPTIEPNALQQDLPNFGANISASAQVKPQLEPPIEPSMLELLEMLSQSDNEQDMEVTRKLTLLKQLLSGKAEAGILPKILKSLRED